MSYESRRANVDSCSGSEQVLQMNGYPLDGTEL